MEAPEFYDIYDMCFVPFWQTRWFYWLQVCCIVVGAILCSLMLVICCWRFIYTRTMPCDKQALKALESAYLKKILHDGRVGPFYGVLLDIVKKYCEQRYVTFADEQ